MKISTTGFKGSSKKKLYTLMATVALTTMGGTTVLNVVAPATTNAAIVTNGQGQQVDNAGADIAVRMGATAIDYKLVHFNEVPANFKETIQVAVPAISGYTANKNTVSITKFWDGFYLITDSTPLRYTSISGDNASDGSEQLTQTEGGYVRCSVGPQGMMDEVFVNDGPTVIGQTAIVKVPQKAGYTANHDTVEVVYDGNVAGHRSYITIGDELVYTLNDDSSSNSNAGSSSTGSDTTSSSSSSSSSTSTDKDNAKDSSSKADSKTPAASTKTSATKTSSAKADVQTGVADGMLPTIAAGTSSVIAALGLAIRKHF